MTIKQWLNSSPRNYAVGVALYNTFGADPLLKDMFEQGPSPVREQRLARELLQLKDIDHTGAVDLAVPRIEMVQVAAASMPEQIVPEQQDPLRKDWMPLYQEMNMLRHNLESAAGDMERGKMAFKILALEQQCMAIWARRDFQLRTGRELPAESNSDTETFADPAKLQQRIATLRTFISKYSKPSDNPKWPLHLQRYSAELEQRLQELQQL